MVTILFGLLFWMNWIGLPSACAFVPTLVTSSTTKYESRTTPKRLLMNWIIDNHDQPEERIIDHPTHPFKLWLEFEHTSPWPDPTNDFCIIDVDTLDGRHYGINVWTFKVVETLALQTNDERQRGMYLTAPDLLVKELTRPCIEFTIGDLLLDSEGNLEDWSNDSIYNVKFLPPWQDALSLVDDPVYNQIEEEFAALMGFNRTDIFVEGYHKDTGEIAIEAYVDGGGPQASYFVVAACPQTRSLVSSNKDSVVKYCSAKRFWKARLGPDIRADIKQNK